MYVHISNGEEPWKKKEGKKRTILFILKGGSLNVAEETGREGGSLERVVSKEGLL